MTQQRTIDVAITYQRAVLIGAEQALLRDILIDIGRLRQDTVFGNAYRRVYSDKSGVKPEDARKLLASGKTILVVGDPGDATAKTRIVTDQGLIALLNDKIPESEWPTDETGKKREFLPKDVTLDSKGQWPPIDSTGRTAQPLVQRPEVLGGTPVQMTPADLEKIQTLQSDAESLGVSPTDYAAMHDLRVSPAAVAKSSRIQVSWLGTEIADSSKLLSGRLDALRSFGPRPGGINYVGSPSGQDDDPYLPDPAANVQKKDSYAVLRVVSGFTPAAGDLLAPTKRSADFKVLFATNKFLVQDVQEAQAERIALVETFGETLLYAFGERPKMYTYSGTLMDTQGLNWLNEWREAYRTKFRATASLKLKARVFLIYRDVAREGIIVANANSLSVAELGSGRFSFQMFVMREYFLDGRPKIDAQNDESSGLDITPVDQDEPLYVLSSIRDETPEPKIPALTDKSPAAGALRAALSSEGVIIERRRSEIEARIREEAFPGGKYTHSSGTFDLGLSDKDVLYSSNAFRTRSTQEEWSRDHQGAIVEVR